MNKTNLLKLAKFLEGNPKHFNMREFANKGRQDLNIDEVDCKSVCCAIGFSPIVLPRLTAKYVKENWHNDWYGLSYSLYGVSKTTWDWLFASYWSKVDNTPTGAAMRIRHVTNYGVPDWFTLDLLRIKDGIFVEKYKEWKRERTVNRSTTVG